MEKDKKILNTFIVVLPVLKFVLGLLFIVIFAIHTTRKKFLKKNKARKPKKANKAYE